MAGPGQLPVDPRGRTAMSRCTVQTAVIVACFGAAVVFPWTYLVGGPRGTDAQVRDVMERGRHVPVICTNRDCRFEQARCRARCHARTGSSPVRGAAPAPSAASFAVIPSGIGSHGKRTTRGRSGAACARRGWVGGREGFRPRRAIELRPRGRWLRTSGVGGHLVIATARGRTASQMVAETRGFAHNGPCSSEVTIRIMGLPLPQTAPTRKDGKRPWPPTLSNTPGLCRF
jgi:hypothetical protein